MTTPGCTGCGSSDTATIDGVTGRRCANCPPTFRHRHFDGLVADGFDPGPYLRTFTPAGYRPDFADHLVELGRGDAAFAYLRSSLTREIDTRFASAVSNLWPTLRLGTDIVIQVRRCWCGRPIRDDAQVECAEHDDGVRHG